jgi:hypothetical protein
MVAVKNLLRPALLTPLDTAPITLFRQDVANGVRAIAGTPGVLPARRWQTVGNARESLAQVRNHGEVSNPNRDNISW